MNFNRRFLSNLSPFNVEEADIISIDKRYSKWGILTSHNGQKHGQWSKTASNMQLVDETIATRLVGGISTLVLCIAGYFDTWAIRS